MFYFPARHPLAFVYTIVYHIYTFLFRYGHTHDQYPQVPGEHAKPPQRGTKEKCAFPNHAPLYACCQGRTDQRRSGVGGIDRTDGQSAERLPNGQNIHGGGGTEIVGPLRLHYGLDALAEAARLPPHIANRIFKKMNWFASQSNPFSFAKPLQNFRMGSHRFRVGDYRVIVEYAKESKTLLVGCIRHRSKAYE